jgi:hypothetical protein
MGGAPIPFAALVIALFGAMTALGALAIALIVAIDHWHAGDGLRERAAWTGLVLLVGTGVAYTRLGICLRLHLLERSGCVQWIAPADSIGHVGLALIALFLSSMLLRQSRRLRSRS